MTEQKRGERDLVFKMQSLHYVQYGMMLQAYLYPSLNICHFIGLLTLGVANKITAGIDVKHFMVTIKFMI